MCFAFLNEPVCWEVWAHLLEGADRPPSRGFEPDMLIQTQLFYPSCVFPNSDITLAFQSRSLFAYTQPAVRAIEFGSLSK
jgi:hypothetical protein